VLRSYLEFLLLAREVGAVTLVDRHSYADRNSTGQKKAILQSHPTH
jgi:hypothetical protein